MGSFGILRTNTSLTSNVKVVVDSSYKLYLESFDSISDLSDDKFKKYNMGVDELYEEVIPKYYKDVSPNTIFLTKYDNDNDKVSVDFINQIDNIYLAGCDNVIDTNYKEEFECFAPLHIDINKIPSKFIIFRTDNPGFIKLDKNNFREKILDELKVIHMYDISNKTPLGKWIDKNYLNNKNFPKSPMEIDYRKDEPSIWNGVDCVGGGYVAKFNHYSDEIKNENTFFEFDKSITDGFLNNKLIYPNIINFKFLFDDTPATQTSLRKWSINKYYGFYLNNMELVKSITPYSPIEIRNDIKIITDNIILNSINNESINPLLNVEMDLSETYFMEIEGTLYKFIKTIDNITGEDVYKIIADIDLSGKENMINKNICVFDINDNITIKNNAAYNINPFNIVDFDKADVWIIEIDKKFHRIKYNNVYNSYYIHSDYGFNISKYVLKYWINSIDSSYTTSININDKLTDDKPMVFNIYKCDFTEIKDFDYSIINTDFARYEYEMKEDITNTDEPKLYTSNPNIKSFPEELDLFKYKEVDVNIPVTSEYVMGREIFEVESNKELSSIWRKNPLTPKWSIKNSLSAYDYPYRLNNSTKIDTFNRTVNPLNITPNRSDRNLDYFYTINPDNNDYIDHSLHITITDDNGVINTNYDFNIEKYFNYGVTYSNSGDYFQYLFGKKEYINNGDIIRPTKKYSSFNSGDKDTTNSTLFRGIKFNIHKVENIKYDNNSIEDISTSPTNEFDNYDFSILLSSYNNNPLTDFSIINNNMEWEIIEQWMSEKEYIVGTKVIYDNVIYTSSSVNTINDPNDNPFVDNNNNWNVFPDKTILYNPLISYSIYDIIYYNNEYLVKTTLGSYPPTNINWVKIPIFNETLLYSMDERVFHGGIVYKSLVNNNNNEIIDITKWGFAYSLVPSNTKTYGNTVDGNSIIEIDGYKYLLIDNLNNDVLDNGINIYINKKWKNILINMYINDNTILNIKNDVRDNLYKEYNKKLTANNLINSLNDISEIYGYINPVTYYVIEEDGSYKNYNDTNYKNLPYIMTVNNPDQSDIDFRNLVKNIKSPNRNLIKVIDPLKKGIINNIDDINKYKENQLLGVTYIQKNSTLKTISNDSGLKNIDISTIFRFSGDVEPIFNTISLFKSVEEVNSGKNNYLFDTSYDDFGIIKEMIVQKVSKPGKKILLFSDNETENSTYPMIDEFGYMVKDMFIFKSTWDLSYYTLSDSRKL